MPIILGGSNVLAKYTASGTINAIATILKAFGIYSSSAEEFAKNNIYNISYQDEGNLNGDFLSNLATGIISKHLGSVIPISGKDVGWFLTGHSIVSLNNAISEYNSILKHFNSNVTYKELTNAYLATAIVHQGKGYETLQSEFKKIGVFESKDDSLNLDIITTTLNLQNAFSPTHITTPALYALVHLNPFIVSGVDSPAYKELEKYKDEYSDNYIQDKAVMFKKALDGKAAINGIYFKDYESNLDLDTTKDFNGMYDEYHFGTNSNDTIEPIGTKISLDKNRIYALGGDDHIKAPNGSNYIEAGSGNDTIDLRGSKGENTVYGGVNNGKDNDDDGDDTIYAGQGKDTIYGGNGKDTIYTDNDDKEDLLYGGTGFDTYYVGDKDIIFDSDGKGKVVFDGVELKGGTYDKDKGAYVSKDGLIEYRLNESGGKSTLTVQKGGKSITINEFSKEDKSLGVELYGGKITVSISDSSAIESAQTMKFDISLDRKLEGDEYIILRVNDKKYLFGTPPKDGNINEDMFNSISSDGKTIVYNYEWKNDEIPQGDRDFIVAPVVEGVSDNLTVNSINPAKGTIKDDDRKPNEPDPEYYDPIIIDLNKDGTTTSKLNGAVNFDIDSNGFKEATGWISKDDAFLAYDRNGNGKIDNGSELFGDKTIADTQRGYTGKTAKNGFEALKAFDTNHDNIIDERDEEFGKLLLWQDKNSNAATDEGELKTLKEHNIKSIDLRYKETQIDNNGNLIKQTSTITFNDNTTTTVDDVWFKVDLRYTEQPSIYIPERIKALP
jgi:type I secretion target GGXGXDXXX repeat protein domain protein